MTMCIIETNHEMTTRIFSLKGTPGNELNQMSYYTELEDVSMMLVILK